MLQKLVVNNYAIIEHLTFEPDGRLNTITGETGAGKSIILGAFSLILGTRADTSVLINKEQKCVVEAYFDIKENLPLKSKLKKNDIDDEDDLCIIRREVSKTGRSRAFVNDTPVTISVLNELTSLLVDLHQQFDHLALEDNLFQLDVIDAIANNGRLLDEYYSVYIKYKQVQSSLKKLKDEQAQNQKDKDYKLFQLSELDDAAFKEGEIEDAEQLLKQLENGEVILNVLQHGTDLLDSGERPLVNELRRFSQQLDGVKDVMAGAGELQKRMESVYIELKDIATELNSMQDKVQIDEELMNQLQERVDLGYKLLKKHGVQTTSELLEIQQHFQKELDDEQNVDDEITSLEKEFGKLNKEIENCADKLSKSRVAIAPELSRKMNTLLALVGMPNACMKIAIEQSKDYGKKGADTITFLLDANKSGSFTPMYKAASGGEMSRIMLCLKSLTAKAMQLPTLIFDEVDSGISGEAARQVSLLLSELAVYHQVICITHQPQIAGKGTRHFYVFKESLGGDKIKTQIRTLNPDERVEAIAKMIGGENPSKAAMLNAKELMA